MKMLRSLFLLGLASVLALSPALTSGRLLGQAASTEGPEASLLSAAERRARDGDIAGALADYEQLVQQFPESPQAPEALLRIARGQLAVGDRAAAVASVERLVTTYPGASQAASGLVLEGRIRSERPAGVEDLESARKTLEKTWLLFPRTDYPALAARSAAHVLDGELALRLGRNEEAISAFLEVLEMEPESRWSADAHVGLGMALVRAGEWEAAAESFQDALGISRASDASLALARARLGLLNRRLVRPATGTRLWTRARRLPVSGAEVKRLTGIAADDLGRLLVVDSGASQVLLLSAVDGGVNQRWSIREPKKPSWDLDSNALLATDDSVVLPGETSRQFQAPGREKTLDGIRAVERSAFGEWIVLASRSNGVISYPAERGSGRVLLGGDGDPVDLTTDRLDRLYVLERKDRRVIRVDLGGDRERATAVNGAWRQAVALAVDPFGYVHVLDAGAGKIHTYDSSGKEVGAVGPVLPGGIEIRKADDMAGGGDGRLFIADPRAGLIVLE